MILRAVLYGAAVWVFLAGVWRHDWRLITAAAAVSLVAALDPFMDADGHATGECRRLDDDYDLAVSA